MEIVTAGHGPVETSLSIKKDVRNALVGDSLGKLEEETELKTIGQPDLKLDDIELPETGPMQFSFEVEVAPQFELPELKGIRVERRTFEVDDARMAQPRQRLQAESGGHTAKEPEAPHQGRLVVGLAVLPQVTGDYGRGGVVLVEQELGHGVAALGAVVPDQAINGPEADLGFLGLGEPDEVLEGPDRLRQGCCLRIVA